MLNVLTTLAQTPALTFEEKSDIIGKLAPSIERSVKTEQNDDITINNYGDIVVKYNDIDYEISYHTNGTIQNIQTNNVYLRMLCGGDCAFLKIKNDRYNCIFGTIEEISNQRITLTKHSCRICFTNNPKITSEDLGFNHTNYPLIGTKINLGKMLPVDLKAVFDKYYKLPNNGKLVKIMALL
jgi:hypothetical protein